MNVHLWLPKLLTALISILQASTLRERYYMLEQRIEILETAISDIERISGSRVESSERHRLIKDICLRCQSRD
jgi:hypothetical protein